MFSELKTDLKIPPRRMAGEDVRLSPVQPRSTLLTVIFFSAVALAIGYWIFFPPAAPTTPETTAAPDRPEFPGRSLQKANIQFARINCAPRNSRRDGLPHVPFTSW